MSADKNETTTKTTAKIEVIRGVEGLTLYINNIRVVGPKPWGGGTCIASWSKARTDWIIEALQERRHG